MSIYWFVIAALVLGTVPDGARAESSISTQLTGTASAALVFEADDFTHTTRSVVLTKLRRFFTVSKSKDAELTDAITNALLMTAMKQQAAGNASQANATLAKYQRESELLASLVTTLQSNTDNAATQQFLSELTTDRVVQLAALESSLGTAGDSADLATKLASEQAKVLREIVKVLEQETDPVERDQKLAELFDHYDKKQTTIEAKLAKRLALTAKLDDETDDALLEADLDQEEDSAVEEAGKLDETSVDDLLAELDEVAPSHRAALLTKLLEKVPAGAKLSIENAIDQLVKAELQSSSTNDAALKAFVDSHADSTEIQDKVIDRLKEYADPATKKKIETIKKSVEADRESAKKAAERAKEDAQKASESSDSNGAQDSQDDRSTEESSGERSQASGTTSSTASESSSSTEVQKVTVEIKVGEDGKLEGANQSVKKGSTLTVKFKNESETARTLSLSNGKSATIGKGETSITAFTIDTALTFTISGLSSTGTISVQ